MIGKELAQCGQNIQVDAIEPWLLSGYVMWGSYLDDNTLTTAKMISNRLIPFWKAVYGSVILPG